MEKILILSGTAGLFFLYYSISCCLRARNSPPRKDLYLIKVVIDDIKKNDECLICYESLEKTGMKMKCRCNALYHHKCIMNWFEKKVECPMCRHLKT